MLAAHCTVRPPAFLLILTCTNCSMDDLMRVFWSASIPPAARIYLTGGKTRWSGGIQHSVEGGLG